MVEVIVAVLILTVGILGLAGTTGWVVRQTTMADVMTERAAARQAVAESLRARPFADIADGSTTAGDFDVAWEVVDSRTDSWSLRLITTGQGMARTGSGPPSLRAGVSDTLVFHIVEVQPPSP